jgi:hypothetical protein
MSLLDTASLIVTPNGVKEGKLYSVIPSDGSGDLSVTRATTATRVNSAGLVELVPYNQFNYSQKFDNAYWIKSSSNVTADNTTAPDGTTTADKMTITGAFGAVYASSIPLEGTHTISCFFKKGDASSVYINTNGTSGNIFGSLNLDTLATSSVGGAIVNVENAGNGWYRLSITASFTGTTSYIAFGILSASTNLFTYLWGAQLVQGSTAKPYQKTETRLNIPRLDYSNGTCPSLLVEPQRTNRVLYSSSFDNAAWGLTGGVTITANNTTAPSGVQDADRYIESTNANYAYEFVTDLSGTFTASLYVKKASSSTIGFGLVAGGFSGGMSVKFNFDTQTFSTPINHGNFSSITASYEALDNGWYRLILTGTTATATPYYFVIGSLQESYAANTYIWGAQLEAGNYPTSYIPTQGASVTRNADVISKTGISSLIGQTEGTLFLDFYYDGSSNNHMIIRDSGYSSYIYFNSPSANQLYGQIQTINIQFSMSATAGRYKCALAYKSGSSAMYVNGTQIGTSATTFTLSGSMSIIDFTLTTPNNAINAAALWKQRLTNTQLQQLTTI